MERTRTAMPRVTGILETCLYVDDLARAARFYENLFGFRRLQSDERFCAFDVAERSVLILFLRKSHCHHPVILPGGVIPTHDGAGPMHLAFAIPSGELPAWEQRLTEHGIAIESRVKWPLGGESIYFRDSDDHLVELATPGIWAIY